MSDEVYFVERPVHMKKNERYKRVAQVDRLKEKRAKVQEGEKDNAFLLHPHTHIFVLSW